MNRLLPDLRGSVDPLLPPDPKTPRGRIQIAATELFAEYGYKGVNTRTIAKSAGVKQVMINYYFGSKEGLYDAVLKFEGMTMLEVIFGFDARDRSPEEMLVDVPIRLMTVLHDNPRWASLFRREIAEGSVRLRRALGEVAGHGPLGTTNHFGDSYRLAVQKGKVRSLPVEAVRECLLAIGYSALYLAPLVALISGRDVRDETVWEEWKLTLSTILKRGLLVNQPE